MAGSTLSSTISTEVTLGYGRFLSPLSITPQGAVDNASGYGILASDLATATVVNSGSVIGSSDGIYISQSSFTLVNQGYVEGGQAGIKLFNFTAGEALVENSGTLDGRRGITGQEAVLTNTGSIYGADYGVNLAISTVVNAAGGSIGGRSGVYAMDDTLTNEGSIHGNSVGVSLSGGIAINYGSISGLGTGVRVVNEQGGDGAVTAGTLLNQSGGSISGGKYYGVYVGGSLTNAGTLSGRIGLGVALGGSAANSGSIYGSSYGAELIGRLNMRGGGSLGNSGSITGGEIGVTVGINGQLTNSGYVYGPRYGVALYNGYVTNSGRILGGVLGVTISGNSVLNNTLSGSISGSTDGVAMSTGLVTNYGTIYGTSAGVVATGGSLANFGTITGGQYGISDSGASITNYGVIASNNYGLMASRALVTNAGTISGKGGVDGVAIQGNAITLAADPGAVFIGQVENLSGKGTLELAGSGIGTLSGIGTQFTGFKEISFATNPGWTIEGNEAGLAEGTTIIGFGRYDTIVLDGFSATSESYVKNTGLELESGTNSVTLEILGNLTTGSFQLSESGGDTTIADVTCFAAGTRLATPDGEVAVEALRIGDRVRTLYAGARPVKWIGRRSYDGRFIRGNKAVLPVCIKAGALAEGVPARDLFVSPGHAISIDGVLVHAGRLVNGVSIVQAEEVAEVHYYHVELEDHEILLAENCPAESFMGEEFRRQFQNAAEFAALYPGQVAPWAMCQPRLDSGFQLHAIQLRLNARAGLAERRERGKLRGYVDSARAPLCFGWAQDVAAPEAPVSLDIFAAGRRIGRVLANLYRADVAAASYGSGYQGFEFALPKGVSGPVEVRRSEDGASLESAAGAKAA